MTLILGSEKDERRGAFLWSVERSATLDRDRHAAGTRHIYSGFLILFTITFLFSFFRRVLFICIVCRAHID